MTGEVEFYGKFSGTAWQEVIFRNLYGMLCEEPRMTDNDGICLWIEETTDWDSSFDEEHECLFASLAKALPDAPFSYEVRRVHYDMEQWCHDVDYSKGTLKLESIHIENFHFDEENEEWDYETDINSSDEYIIDSKGIHDERLSKECTEFEKERLSDWFKLMDTGTDDPAELLLLGILYETGPAEVGRNLTAAWDCYLKAAKKGDRDAIKLIKNVFSDEGKEYLCELLTKKNISREAYPIFFDLAAKENKPELMEKLLDYKSSLE